MRKDKKRRHFNDGGIKRLYLIQFEDGSIKVGISGSLSSRFRTHRAKEKIVKAHILGFSAYFWDEGQVCRRLAKLGKLVSGSTERFTGVSWDQALAECRKQMLDRVELNHSLLGYDEEQEWIAMQEEWMPFVMQEIERRKA